MKFFDDLHNEHQRIIEALNVKIEETSEAAKLVSDKDVQEFVPLRSKLFEVLRLIYLEQKAVGA